MGRFQRYPPSRSYINLAQVRIISEGPATGEQVELYDGVEEGEGNRCRATVTDIKGSIIYLELDWSTWTPAESEEARVARVI